MSAGRAGAGSQYAGINPRRSSHARRYCNAKCWLQQPPSLRRGYPVHSCGLAVLVLLIFIVSLIPCPGATRPHQRRRLDGAERGLGKAVS